MRLLHVWTWQFQLFPDEGNRPEYAILSHTWSSDEVTLQEWKDATKNGVEGIQGARFDKIRNFGLLVRGDMKCWEGGLAWIWVDTCCIDKSSSAELSEAINSMFTWYSRAKICFAYLDDINPPRSIAPLRYMEFNELLITESYNPTRLESEQEQLDRVPADFVGSRWFTRGWTLQELLAPQDVVFLYNDWTILGHKLWPEVVQQVADRTTISVAALSASAVVAQRGEWSIAMRMSWAAERFTTRGEDMAYCLMGLFNVNMPLLYGEGAKRAFQRLQENIMVSSHDQSLFAWGSFVSEFTSTVPHRQFSPKAEMRMMPSWRPDVKPELCGLLAESPMDFWNSGYVNTSDISYSHQLYRETPPRIVNGGVLLGLVIPGTARRTRCTDHRYPPITWYEEFDIATLLCRVGDNIIAIALHVQPDGYHCRTRELITIPSSAFGPPQYEMWTETRHIVDADFVKWKFDESFRDHDVFLRTWDVDLPFVGVRCYGGKDEASAWFLKKPAGLWGQWSDTDISAKVVFFYRLPKRNKIFGIVMQRLRLENDQGMDLSIGMTDPISVKESQLARDHIFLKEEIALPESIQMHTVPPGQLILEPEKRKGVSLLFRLERVDFPPQFHNELKTTYIADEEGTIHIQSLYQPVYEQTELQSMHVVDLSVSYESRRAALRWRLKELSERTLQRFKRQNETDGVASYSSDGSVTEDDSDDGTDDDPEDDQSGPGTELVLYRPQKSWL